MDVLVCNGLGIYCGMKTLEWLSLKTYKWQGLWNIPTYKYVSRAADLRAWALVWGLWGLRGGAAARMLPPVNSTWDMTLGIALTATRTSAHPGHPAPCPPFWGHPSAAASLCEEEKKLPRKRPGGAGRPACPERAALADGRCFQGQDEEDRVPVHALQLGSLRVEAGLQPAPLAGSVRHHPGGKAGEAGLPAHPSPGSPPPSSAPSFF